ncbi:hypothetical protein JKP88DRAFT_243839 [Tribonema minus]|uniref:Uncharacterized protein n=1 Tax=Tribonema minus TaxID=303371 RepID=A0A835Z9F5_9STRA|nr:hypothetical protein JKP88DRAFT_243839 [Tribonema minus]
MTAMYPFALDGDNCVVLPRQAKAMGGNHTCPGCSGAMVPCVGSQLTPHFRHKSVTTTCGGGGFETYMHEFGKKFIAMALEQILFTKTCGRCGAICRRTFENAKGVNELKHGSYTLDVAVQKDLSVIGVVEVMHTHQTEITKCYSLQKQLGYASFFEIMATDIFNKAIEGGELQFNDMRNDNVCDACLPGGIRFRSPLEQQWAAMFSNLGWIWEYKCDSPWDIKGYTPAFIIDLHRPVLVDVQDTATYEDLSQHEQKIWKSGWEGPYIIVGAHIWHAPESVAYYDADSACIGVVGYSAVDKDLNEHNATPGHRFNSCPAILSDAQLETTCLCEGPTIITEDGCYFCAVCGSDDERISRCPLIFEKAKVAFTNAIHYQQQRSVLSQDTESAHKKRRCPEGVVDTVDASQARKCDSRADHLCSVVRCGKSTGFCRATGKRYRYCFVHRHLENKRRYLVQTQPASPRCWACLDSGTAYWSEDMYGPCFECNAGSS